jgi:hypothetical protein
MSLDLLKARIRNSELMLENLTQNLIKFPDNKEFTRRKAQVEMTLAVLREELSQVEN